MPSYMLTVARLLENISPAIQTSSVCGFVLVALILFSTIRSCRFLITTGSVLNCGDSFYDFLLGSKSRAKVLPSSYTWLLHEQSLLRAAQC